MGNVSLQEAYVKQYDTRNYSHLGNHYLYIPFLGSTLSVGIKLCSRGPFQLDLFKSFFCPWRNL